MNTLVSEGGVEVEFHDEQGASFRLVVLGNTLLRDVQKILVQWLGLPFPSHSATLIKPDGSVFWDFNSKPFRDAISGSKNAYLVKGEPTGDMYFIDKMFRLTRESES